MFRFCSILLGVHAYEHVFPVFPVFPCAFETHKRVPKSNELLVFGAYEPVFPVFPGVSQTQKRAYESHECVPESNKLITDS